MDAKQLYQEVILDHNKKPRNWGKLDGATHRSEGLNPLCGDHIWVALKLDGERIDADRVRGRVVRDLQGLGVDDDRRGQGQDGRTRRSAWSRVSAAWRRASSTRRPRRGELGRLTVFAGVKDLPTRVKCAILPWHTLHAAFRREATATTEGAADPVAQAG